MVSDTPVAKYSIKTEDRARLWSGFPLWLRFAGIGQVILVGIPIWLTAFFLGMPIPQGGIAAFVLVAVWRVHRLTNSVRKGIDFDQVESTEVRIRTDYLEMESASSLWLRSWRYVAGVQPFGNDLIVVFSRFFRMLIPARGFESPLQADRFRESAWQRIQSAKEAQLPVEMPKIVLNPFPISVRYQSTRWLFANQQTFLSQNRIPTSMGFIQSFMFAVFPALVAFSTGFLVEGKAAMGGLRLLTELFVWVGLMFVFLIGQILVGKLFQRFAFGKETSESLDVQVDVNEKGMEVRTDEQTMFLAWSYLQLGPAMKDRSLAVLAKTGNPVALIPVRAFQHEGHRQAFAKMVSEQAAKRDALEWIEAEMISSRPARETGNPFQAPEDQVRRGEDTRADD